MSAPQRIIRERRLYNKWVASQTLEDYALRYTADGARRWPASRIGNTAFGAIAFLACEAIGGALTLSFGFANTIAAIGFVCTLMFFIALPINRMAAQSGLDIDLLTRGAGFGYMGSTITSLIYASFTFLLFAIEAAIMSAALEMALGIPLWLAHMVSALGVIPIALYGIRFISRMQIATQPLWLTMQFLPLGYLLLAAPEAFPEWVRFSGIDREGRGFEPLLFAAASSTLLALLPQIGEQADYLRFLPSRARTKGWVWWSALIAGGPGWVFMGGLKMALGSLLAWWAFASGADPSAAEQPTTMFRTVFEQMTGSPGMAVALTLVFVVTCQLKINVTNAYAGSIAWSNFFSPLTHAHPGRVVWLVFNVLLALLLMEIGIFSAIAGVLVFYANFAVGWIGALAADLVINKPLGLSPRGIEFKRAYLYDINPVGIGAMLTSIAVSTIAYSGLLGPELKAWAPFAGLVTAFVTAPAIALLTRGRYYLARPSPPPGTFPGSRRCVICENAFEAPDMALCPAYDGPICSLCCSLEARCNDLCKQDSRFGQQISQLLEKLLPSPVARRVNARIGQFLGIFLLSTLVIGGMLVLLYLQYSAIAPQARTEVGTALALVFLCLFILAGVASWLLVLAHESRHAAQEESARQTAMLMEEIAAHQRTDAALHKAKEAAEAANEAKSRFVFGINHEIRAPLNAIFGYAQLLERQPERPPPNAVRVIRRSAEHLSNLVEGLVDISRIESGRLQISRDRIALRDFLEQIADMFRLQAAAKGIDFHYHCPRELPLFVFTDEKRLRQVLINLLSNAIKFTDAGKTSLTVRYNSSGLTEFEICDTGIGIPQQDLEVVFQPFERGSATVAQQQPGSGLGLAITRVLVQIMGGEIKVESAPGEGSRFLVRIMLVEDPSSGEAAAEATDASSDTPGQRPCNVLAVDDDPTQRSLLKDLLAPKGFDIRCAESAETALAELADWTPDIALLDIALPGMSGWDLASRLRSMKLPVKIVMLSANAHEYRAGGGTSAHDAFLIKPIRIDALTETIDRLRGLHTAGGTPPQESPPSDSSTPLVSPSQLAELSRLVRIGHVRAIATKLDEIEAAGAANRAFVAATRRHLDHFDLKRLQALLEEVRHRVA